MQAERAERGDGRRGFAPRRDDEGGMTLRLSPRRLTQLKEVAAQQGMRPGELVAGWVEERLDAERAGGTGVGAGTGAERLAALEQRVEALAARIEGLTPGTTAAAPETPPAPADEPAPARRRGRPPKREAAAAAPAEESWRGGRTRGRRAPEANGPRVPLHEEITAIIRERGPMTAAGLADAIRERGNYAPPRSAKPLDAATVNARVSNPVYRGRFTRADGRIALAGE